MGKSSLICNRYGEPQIQTTVAEITNACDDPVLKKKSLWERIMTDQITFWGGYI